MKTTCLDIKLAFLVFLVYFLGFGQQLRNTEEELRIMSYNIHHANPPSQADTIDLEAIIKVIQSENPDLLALQEIDMNTERSGQGNQAELIGKALNMNVFFGKSIDYDGGQYGVAILSKFPISKTNIYQLPTKTGTNGEPRILATAVIKLPNAKTLIFGSTHLDAQKADTNRILQAKEINKIVSKESWPFIIAGDFNAESGSPVIDILDKRLNKTCIKCPPTIPASSPKKAIDFITYKPDFFTIEDHQVLIDPRASDHLPVLAVMKML